MKLMPIRAAISDATLTFFPINKPQASRFVEADVYDDKNDGQHLLHVQGFVMVSGDLVVDARTEKWLRQHIEPNGGLDGEAINVIAEMLKS